MKTDTVNCQYYWSVLLTSDKSQKIQFPKMASLRSPSSPSDGYKRFSDDFANTSVNNYGSNVTSNEENYNI